MTHAGDGRDGRGGGTKAIVTVSGQGQSEGEF